jgi:hypothetical protein
MRVPRVLKARSRTSLAALAGAILTLGMVTTGVAATAANAAPARPAAVSQEHTPLIAHTADDIVTSESGLYGSDQGDAIANEYRYYTGAANGSTDTAGSFAYWADPVVDYNTSTGARLRVALSIAQSTPIERVDCAVGSRGRAALGPGGTHIGRKSPRRTRAKRTYDRTIAPYVGNAAHRDGESGSSCRPSGYRSCDASIARRRARNRHR